MAKNGRSLKIKLVISWHTTQDMLDQWAMPINADQCRIKILLLIQNVAQ